MQQKIETVAEFLARGGTIKKCSTKTKVRRSKREVEELEVEEIDYSVLPENLKIRFGIRNGQEE